MLKVYIDEIILKNKNNERRLLSNIHFELPQKNIYTFLGKNGSGKSTLIKALTFLLDKNFYDIKGEVFFNGKNLFNINEKELLELRRDKIKYVFQDAINSFDPLKKIKYYFERISGNEPETDELLDYFILPKRKDLLSLYPYELSGGMAQRVSFVLALLAHPQLIILDEPTSGIDSAIANLFLLKLKECSENNNSVLLVTQDLAFAEKISNKIAYLSDGTLTDFFLVKDFFEMKNEEKLSSFLNAYEKL